MRIENAYYKLNADNKIELHFDGREAYQSLPDDVKKNIKRAFIWGRRRGAWVSRSKGVGIPYQMSAYEIPFEGAEELNTFEDVQERKIERLENKADRYSERARKRDDEAKSLQSEFNKMRKDWSWLTQPNINSSSGRSFTRQRNRILDRYDKGMRLSISADKLREAAQDMRGRASQAELTSEKYLLNRVKEGEKAVKQFEKFQERYKDQLEKIDEQPQDWKVWLMSRMRAYELEFQKLAYFKHHFDLLQNKIKDAGQETHSEIDARLKGFSKELKDYFKNRYGIKLLGARKQFGKGRRSYYFGRAETNIPSEYREVSGPDYAVQGRYAFLAPKLDAWYKSKEAEKPKADLNENVKGVFAQGKVSPVSDLTDEIVKLEAELIKDKSPATRFVLSKRVNELKSKLPLEYSVWTKQAERLIEGAEKVIAANIEHHKSNTIRNADIAKQLREVIQKGWPSANVTVSTKTYKDKPGKNHIQVDAGNERMPASLQVWLDDATGNASAANRVVGAYGATIYTYIAHHYLLPAIKKKNELLDQYEFGNFGNFSDSKAKSNKPTPDTKKLKLLKLKAKAIKLKYKY